MLVLITIARNPAGDNLAAVGDKTLQPLDILIINVIHLLHTESANLAPGKTGSFLDFFIIDQFINLTRMSLFPVIPEGVIGNPVLKPYPR